MPHTFTDKYLREHTPSLDDIIFTRRQFLARTGMGFGALSLASLFGIDPYSADGASTAALRRLGPLAPKQPHFPAKAKARHSHFRRRRPFARRYVGSEAGADEVRRQDDPGA